MTPQLIHVLEDDKDIRDIIGFVLIDAGYQVQLSSSFNEFTKKIRNIPAALFLLDIRLPDGDGRDICRRLKSSNNFNMIPVILISANVDIKNILMETHADGFISKPFDINILVNTIKEKLLNYLPI